jgi:hypothetical protein
LGQLSGLGLMLAGCGGSGGTGDLAGVGSGGTGAAFSFGVISGFGSVIVNGIKYSDDTASVTDDLGNSRGRGDLGLGMVVEIRGSADESTGLGTASSIRIQSELKGPVTSVSPNPAIPGTGQLLVLGTTVRATSTTIWQNASGIAGLSANQTVEVWGFADRNANVMTATRIEIKAGSDGASNRLRGLVTELTPGLIRIGGQPGSGGQTFATSNATIAAGVSVGALVKVLYSGSANPLVATKIEIEASSTPANETLVRAEGRISQYASKSSFKVEGFTVDASVASFSDGLESQLANGARVRVEGQMAGGKIKASIVRFRDEGVGNSGSSGSGSSGSGNSNSGNASSGNSTSSDSYGDEVKGVIVRFNGKENFIVKDDANREFGFDGSTATGKDGGPLPALGVGSAVRVKFTIAGPGLLKATQIRLDS